MGSVETVSVEPRFPFEPDDVLQRVPDLTLRIWRDGSAFFQDYGWQLGPNVLRVLEAFSRPATFRQVVANLQSGIAGMQDWSDLVDTIRGLYALGVIEHAENARDRSSIPPGFDAPGEHISMLNDRERTSAYLTAIPEVVRAGDVVVEIGTGTGVLSMAAARAGARHVYAIETGDIGRSAQTLFEANGLTSQITLIRGRSTQVELPERADVLLSEIIGNEPFQERVLESTMDALRRLLVPEPRLLPRSIRVYGVPVHIPETVVARHVFTDTTATEWSEWYGADMRPLARGNPPSSLRVFVAPHTAKEWTKASEPVLLTEIEFGSPHPVPVESETRTISIADGPINGIYTFFDLALSPSVELSTNPSRVEPRCSWRLPVWILAEPLTTQEGDELFLRYTYPAAVDRRITIGLQGRER